jgi:hypothetical protein
MPASDSRVRAPVQRVEATRNQGRRGPVSPASWPVGDITQPTTNSRCVIAARLGRAAPRYWPHVLVYLAGRRSGQQVHDQRRSRRRERGRPGIGLHGHAHRDIPRARQSRHPRDGQERGTPLHAGTHLPGWQVVKLPAYLRPRRAHATASTPDLRKPSWLGDSAVDGTRSALIIASDQYTAPRLRGDVRA